MRLKHCGRMISNRVWRRENASDSAASHCPDGTDCTAPRTTSEMFAMIGRERPITAFTQAGNGRMTSPMTISKGKASSTMKSSTSQGELRNSWVTMMAGRRMALSGEICISPRKTPATVPIAMEKKLICMLKKKPSTTTKGIQRTSASKASP